MRERGDGPLVLVTEGGGGQHAERIRAVAPAAGLLVLSADGVIMTDRGVAVRSPQVRPEIAWQTMDAFDGPLAREFFAIVFASRTTRWLQRPGAGVDSAVVLDLLRAGVRVTTDHSSATSIAEFVLRAVLEHFQRPDRWRGAQATGSWEPHFFRELAGSTWLVVGYGAIGTAIAERAGAFGARVVAVRRRPRGDETGADIVVSLDRLAEVVGAADVVVLCAPATKEARGLVDDDFLTRMRGGSVLVNVARGALVDEDALLRALDRGIPERAVLDVFSVEPLPVTHPLWRHPRVWTTPHTSGLGDRLAARGVDLFVANLGAYLAGESLLHEVDIEMVAEQQHARGASD